MKLKPHPNFWQTNVFCLLLAGHAIAALAGTTTTSTTVTEDFTGANTNNTWDYVNGACLTAGGATSKGIPACNGLAYYAKDNNVLLGLTNNVDPAGAGALRLTNWFTENGAIFLHNSFSSSNGLNATFTAYVYGGNGGGSAKLGADGMAFYIQNYDAVSYNIGAWGGSLGYDCSNSNYPYNGMVGAYLGLGIDEYGNFSHSSDNTVTGPKYSPNTVAMRGYGDVALSWLQSNYNSDYPSSAPTGYTGTSSQWQTALQKGVQATCETGVVQYYTIGSTPTTGTWASLLSGTPASTTAIDDYAFITNKPLPLSGCPTTGASTLTPSTTSQYPNCQPLANQQNSTESSSSAPTTALASTFSRGSAIPITYSIKLSASGKLTFGYYYNGGTYQPVLTNKDISTSNGPMPANFRFGFGGSTGGSTNVHEITCFTAAPLTSGTGAATNGTASGKLNTGTQLFVAGYVADNWWGTLQAFGINGSGSGSTATVTVNSSATWDGNCVLTGGACNATGTTSGTAEAPANRVILSSSASGAGGGVAFESASLPTATSTAYTNEATTLSSSSANITDWMRGGRSNEQGASPPGVLRTRTGVLGDIIDSNPAAVGPPGAGYGASWFDALYGLSGTSTYLPENTSGATTYPTFSAFATGSYGQRTNVVYAGANDGMLHGFASGAFYCNPALVSNPSSCFQTANNNGSEVLAYMPGTVGANTALLVDPSYSHNYYVDATPGTGDVFYNSTWHTLLAGGMGTGGAGIYLLDVTDPSQFSETNAAKLVLGEWNPSVIACANDVTTGTTPVTCSSDMGQLWGKPVFARLHDGKWAVIFGNGHGSSSGDAGIYIGLISQGTSGPTVTFYYLSTGKASTTSPDGIDYVTAVDLDGDNIADYVYAGDFLGNVWRFNLTSSHESDWAASTYGNASATPLFAAGSKQPISTQVQVAETTLASQTYVMVMFGTGQVTPATNTTGIQYASGSQAVSGIWDWDMGNWNQGHTYTASTVTVPASIMQLAALTPSQVSTALSPATSATTSNLVQQTITDASSTTRTLSDNQFCPQGSSACISGNNQFGWYVTLPDNNGVTPTPGYEQVIYTPLLEYGLLILNTTIPPSGDVIHCTTQTTTGWTMAFNVQTGGSPPYGFFMDSSGKYGSGSSGINGELSNGTGTPTIIGYSTNYYLFTQTTNTSNTTGAVGIWTPTTSVTTGTGTSATTTTSSAAVNPSNIYNGKRVNWEILR